MPHPFFTAAPLPNHSFTCCSLLYIASLADHPLTSSYLSVACHPLVPAAFSYPTLSLLHLTASSSPLPYILLLYSFPPCLSLFYSLLPYIPSSLLIPLPCLLTAALLPAPSLLLPSLPSFIYLHSLAHPFSPPGSLLFSPSTCCNLILCCFFPSTFSTPTAFFPCCSLTHPFFALPPPPIIP